jgi:hypothetical protein
MWNTTSNAVVPWNRFSGENRMDDKTKLEQAQPPAQSHHAEEFTLNFVYVFPGRKAGQAAQQHDRQPGPCLTHLANPRRNHFAL